MNKYKSGTQSGYEGQYGQYEQGGQGGQYEQYEHGGQHEYGEPYPYEEQFENYAASEDPSATAYDYEAQPLEGYPVGAMDAPEGNAQPGGGLPRLTSADIVIAVVGVTGSGKSTFISHFAATAGVYDGLESYTSQVEIHQASVNGRKCYLVDTPGFDDTYRTDTQVLEDLANWLHASYQAQVRLAGVVYLHRICDPRVTGSAMKSLRMFKKLCGDAGLGSVVLATTWWSSLTAEKGAANEKELMAKSQFWKNMIQKGSAVCRQDRDAESAAEILTYIMDLRRPVTLEIQMEMASGKALNETAAGQEVQREMMEMKRRYEKDLDSLKEDMREAIKKRDREAKREIRQERVQLEEKLKKQERDQERLRMRIQDLAEDRDREKRRARRRERHQCSDNVVFVPYRQSSGCMIM